MVDGITGNTQRRYKNKHISLFLSTIIEFGVAVRKKYCHHSQCKGRPGLILFVSSTMSITSCVVSSGELITSPFFFYPYRLFRPCNSSRFILSIHCWCQDNCISIWFNLAEYLVKTYICNRAHGIPKQYHCFVKEVPIMYFLIARTAKSST